MTSQPQRDLELVRNILLTFFLPPVGLIANSIDLVRGIRRGESPGRLAVGALLLVIAVYFTVGIVVTIAIWFGRTETRIDYPGG